MHEIMIIITNR